VTVTAPPRVDEADWEEIPLCFKCLEPVGPGLTSCDRCGNPVSANALALPFEGALQQVRLIAGAGDLQAPSTAIVVGLWIVTLPYVASLAFLPHGLVTVPWVLFTALFATVAVRATRHWRRSRASRAAPPRTGADDA
jgi:hypothetical protein